MIIDGSLTVCDYETTAHFRIREGKVYLGGDYFDTYDEFLKQWIYDIAYTVADAWTLYI